MKWTYKEYSDKFVLSCDNPYVEDLPELSVFSGLDINWPKHVDNREFQIDWTADLIEQVVTKLNNGEIKVHIDEHLKFKMNLGDLVFNPKVKGVKE